VIFKDDTKQELQQIIDQGKLDFYDNVEDVVTLIEEMF